MDASELARAEQLAAQGQLREAAAALEQLPVHQRPPGTEARIVRWRHQAAEQALATPAPGTPWPHPADPDPFPGLGSPPEIAPDQLTPGLLASAIGHHGCLIVRGLLDPEAVDLLRGDIDQAFDHLARAGSDPVATGDPEPTSSDRPDDQPDDQPDPTWYERLALDPGYALDPLATYFLIDKGGLYAAWSPRTFVDFLGIARRVGLTDLVGRYLGEEPLLSLNKCVLRRVSGGADDSFHQDGCYLGTGLRAVNVWVSLSQCGGDTDLMGLDVLPRPMDGLAEMGTHGVAHPSAVSAQVVDGLARECGITVQRPEFGPGDAILFDEVFLHRSDPRPLTEPRYAIESWWFAPSTWPDNQVPVVAR